MKIKTVQELEDILINEFHAVVSSVEEVNQYEYYSLVGDNEHDYSLLHKVYKIDYKESSENPYDKIFLVVFSQNGGILDVKGLGEAPPKLNKLWVNVQWEEELYR